MPDLYERFYISIIDPRSGVRMTVLSKLGEKLLLSGWERQALLNMGYSETEENDEASDMYYDDTVTVESTGEYLTSTEVTVTNLPNGLNVMTSDVVMQESANQSVIQLVTVAATAATTVLDLFSENTTKSVVQIVANFSTKAGGYAKTMPYELSEIEGPSGTAQNRVNYTSIESQVLQYLKAGNSSDDDLGHEATTECNSLARSAEFADLTPFLLLLVVCLLLTICECIEAKVLAYFIPFSFAPYDLFVLP